MDKLINVKCPECKKEMKILLDHSKYHPVGSCDGGVGMFRAFALYECQNCGRYFYVPGKKIAAAALLKTSEA